MLNISGLVGKKVSVAGMYEDKTREESGTVVGGYIKVEQTSNLCQFPRVRLLVSCEDGIHDVPTDRSYGVVVKMTE